jgi:L,D-transpeptidase ErfK/SrfK
MLHVFITLIMGLVVTTAHATTFELQDANTRVVGHNLIVYSHHEDTLLDIGRAFDVGYEEIVGANPGVDPWLPGENQRVIVPNRFILPDAPHVGIVINLAEMRLYYYPKPNQYERQKVITHPIGVGREGWTTPLGKTKIIQRIKDPSWTPPASIKAEHIQKGDPLPNVVAAGPNNPLGAYAMRLGMPGYLLHGTNKPYGVGMRVSHGCIRLFPEDIEHLFGIVAVNTPVQILYQPDKAGLLDGELYLEAHDVQSDFDQRQGNNMTSMVSAILKAQDHLLSDADFPFAEQIVNKHTGLARRVNQPEEAIVTNVWFVHTGLTQNARAKLAQASMQLNLNDAFWPLRNAADGEVILGPFDTQQQADDIVKALKDVTNISAWTAQVSSDAM